MSAGANPNERRWTTGRWLTAVVQGVGMLGLWLWVHQSVAPPAPPRSIVAVWVVVVVVPCAVAAALDFRRQSSTKFATVAAARVLLIVGAGHAGIALMALGSLSVRPTLIILAGFALFWLSRLFRPRGDPSAQLPRQAP